MLMILYILLGVFIIFIIISRFHRFSIDTMLFINIGMLLYYVIPGIRHCYPDFFGYTSNYARFGANFKATYEAFFCVFIFYITFLFVRYINKSYGIEKIKKKNSITYFMINEEKNIKIIAIGILIFSLFTYLIYCSLYGGVQSVLSSIANIREGLIESKNSNLDFVSKLYGVVIFAPFLFYGYKNKKNAYLVWLMVVIAGIIRISTGSRGAILKYIIVFILGNYYNKKIKKLKPKQIILIFAISTFFIVLYRPLLVAASSISEVGIKSAWDTFISSVFNSKSKYSIASVGNTMDSFFGSFDHFSVSLEYAIMKVKDGTHHFNYFLEIPYALISVIPSKLLGITKPITITYYNSTYITGNFIMNIPAGTVAAGYYTFGYIGIIFYAICFSFIGKKIDKKFNIMMDQLKFAPYYYAGILWIYFGFAIGGDLAANFQRYLSTFVVIYIVNSYVKKRYRTKI